MKLSPREQEVTALLGRGFSPAQIARKLGLKQSTVYTYLNAVANQIPEQMLGRSPSRVVAVWAARELAA